jgi:hypothetical protein
MAPGQPEIKGDQWCLPSILTALKSRPKTAMPMSKDQFETRKMSAFPDNPSVNNVAAHLHCALSLSTAVIRAALVVQALEACTKCSLP